MKDNTPNLKYAVIFITFKGSIMSIYAHIIILGNCNLLLHLLRQKVVEVTLLVISKHHLIITNIKYIRSYSDLFRQQDVVEQKLNSMHLIN